VNLENSKDLGAEARALKHCVDGYVNKCKSGYQVYSVRKDGKPQTTAGFNIDRQGNLELDQHHGYRNGKPNQDEKQVIDWLLNEVKEGNINLQTDNIGKINELNKVPELENQLGIKVGDFNEERANDNFTRITKVNSSKYYMLGRKFKDATLDKFLSETGLENIINRVLGAQKEITYYAVIII